MSRPGLVLSCEHGGNRVPARYREALRGARRFLPSHRGIDVGALELARRFARALGVPLVATTVTRLLVDVNRSLGHPRLFSPWSLRLSEAERQRLLERVWRPHRTAIERAARSARARNGRALHLSVHSFTPRFAGRTRTVDVGFLFDPRRRREAAFVTRWMRALAARRPDLRLTRNAPYRGTGDGITTDLRRALGPDYLGIELEVSQRFPRRARADWRALQGDLVASFVLALGSGDG